jgi:hypothetical protein
LKRERVILIGALAVIAVAALVIWLIYGYVGSWIDANCTGYPTLTDCVTTEAGYGAGYAFGSTVFGGAAAAFYGSVDAQVAGGSSRTSARFWSIITNPIGGLVVADREVEADGWQWKN